MRNLNGVCYDRRDVLFCDAGLGKRGLCVVGGSMEGLFLKRRDQLCLELVLKVVAGEMRPEQAEQLLGISERTLRRYLKEYRKKGIGFIRHGNKGRAPANKKVFC
jgi:hypothetical protein